MIGRTLLLAGLAAGVLSVTIAAAQTPAGEPAPPLPDVAPLPPIGPGPAGRPPSDLGPLGLPPVDAGPVGLPPGAPGPAGWPPHTPPLNEESMLASAMAFGAPLDQGEREAAAREREDELYEDGQEALEEGRWQRAVERFSELAKTKGPRSDAAMYWRAYALDRMGQKVEALSAVVELIKAYPSSRWINDAKALELQVRQSAGQPVSPEVAADEELKLLALQGLQHSDPETAVPMLEKILQGPQSPRMKERALFVLAQSQSPRARQVLAGIAKGGSNPDLQLKAIQYLGIHGNAENRELLAQIYDSTTDIEVKRRILRAFGISGERARVLAAATSEKSPELRATAVHQLGIMGAREELWQLYQKESSLDVKKRILQAMFVGGDAARMSDLAVKETNPELRRVAIRNLGLMGAKRTGETLTSLYAKEKDPTVRKTIIEAFFLQGNAEQLVAIARKETDPAMRKEIVGRLSHMRSKVALDYLMEILNK